MKQLRQGMVSAVIALCMTVGHLLCFLSAFKAGDYTASLHSPANGVLLTANAFLRFLTAKTGRICLPFACVQNRDYLFVIAVLCLLSFGLYLLARRRTMIPALLWLAGTMLGCGFGLFPSGVGLAILVVGFFLLLTQRLQPDAEWKGFLCRALALSLCMLLLCTVFRSAPASAPLRSAASARVHRLRHDPDDPLPEGDLRLDTSSAATDKPLLRLQMQTPGGMYLRSFVGEQFDGTRWTATPNAVLAGCSDLFYWLHTYGFSAVSQPALALRQAGETQMQRVTITRVSGKGRYACLPFAGNAPALSDPLLLRESVRWTDEDDCTAEVPVFDKAALFDAQKAVAALPEDATYLRCERAYAAFVRSTCLDVPPQVAGVFRRQIDDTADAGLYDIICFVLDWFASYTQTPSPQPYAGGDAVVWFLEQSKCGSDAMFAAASVLMLRYLGVPARYAEGYVVSAASTEMTVTGENAHVWAEYYLDGVGWIPLETVPDLSTREKQFYNTYADGTAADGELRRAEIRQPQTPMRPAQTPQTAKTVLRVVLVLCLCVILALLFLLLLRRLRLRARLRRIDALPPGEKIAALYAYARSVQNGCGVTLPDEEAHALYAEALFSDHAMTPQHVRTMQSYADKTIAACKRADGTLRQIKHRVLDALY